jgi:hypothetical protein
MRKNLRIAFYLLVAGCFTQCKVFDNDVLVPGYVYIPSYKFVTSGDGSQGDSASEYSDMWIYSRGNLEGAFALPALIPIQHNGSIEMGIDAGVIRTGQNDERIPYPLVSRYYQTIELKPGEVDTIYPEFHYTGTNEFLLIEDFDNPGLRFSKYRSEAGDSIIKYNGEGVKTPGKYSGKIDLSANSTDVIKEFMMTSIDIFDLRRGEKIFWEVDYNTDVSLRFGFFATDLTGQTTIVPMFYSNVTDGKWKRLYIDLSEEVGARGTGTRYRPFIQILRYPGTSKPNIMLDNIKLIRN